MFGLTTIKKSKVERLQARVATEKINNSQLLDEVTVLRKENKILREANARLFEKSAAARKRDEKGHFLPKNQKLLS